MASLLAKQGFVVLKQVVPVAICRQLRDEGIQELARANTNFVYNVKRMIPQLFQTSIRSQHQRHVLPCRLMESSPAREALKFAAMAATSQCQLSAHLNLVELNYTVSLPGSQEQEAHTDISPTADQSLYTIWLALQDISLAMGPTQIWLGSHILARDYLHNEMKWEIGTDAEKERQNSSATLYNSEGELEGEVQSEARMAQHRRYGKFCEVVTALGSEQMTLHAGDMVVMDCRAWHRGGANRSATDRYLFNMTFQGQEVGHESEELRGTANVDTNNGVRKKLYGFTYDTDSSASIDSGVNNMRGADTAGWHGGLRMIDLMHISN